MEKKKVARYISTCDLDLPICWCTSFSMQDLSVDTNSPISPIKLCTIQIRFTTTPTFARFNVVDEMNFTFAVFYSGTALGNYTFDVFLRWICDDSDKSVKLQWFMHWKRARHTKVIFIVDIYVWPIHKTTLWIMAINCPIESFISFSLSGWFTANANIIINT